MCGIAGVWSVESDRFGSIKDRVTAMASSIQHRGPDDAGLWVSSNATAILAHQRLAIQDLSELGHQPMTAASGRYVIVFNGEIYNFKRLSAELNKLGLTFRGHSDTEVMLAAFDVWGVESSLQRFDGMFAFAVYDTIQDELWLARDRMGEKPLYYGFIDGRLVFCSELKGILIGIDRALPLNWSGFGSYFRFGYFSVTETPFADIRKLRPATFVRLSRDELSGLRDTAALAEKETCYWRRSASDEATHHGADTSMELEELLSAAVLDQAVADVGVGVFLSGGIDSTLVAALLQKNSKRKVNTYTIAFDSPQYNEAPFAKDIARHLGTDHVEIPIAIEECMAVIGKLPDLLDEPFADASLIPSYLVCREARKHVTVCLSGDGGDELFGGYNRYSQGARLWDLSKRLPSTVRSLVGGGLAAIPERMFDVIYSPFAQISGASGRKAEKDIGSKMHKFARGLTARSNKELYADLLSFWRESPLADARFFPTAEASLLGCYVDVGDFATAAMQCDIDFYLVCDNLFKVDRAAMASSLEVRLPLLDRRVVEYSGRIPLDQKIRNGSSKHILREVLYKHVPEALMSRPKMGFSVPLSDWLRAGLRSWAEPLLLDRDGLIAGGLNPDVIGRVWREHVTGRRDNANALWTILAYLQWRSANAAWIQLA